MIRAISSNLANARARETIYASGVSLFMWFGWKVIAAFVVACSLARLNVARLNSADSVVCTEQRGGIDNSHDQRDESGRITLPDEFTPANDADQPDARQPRAIEL